MFPVNQDIQRVQYFQNMFMYAVQPDTTWALTFVKEFAKQYLPHLTLNLTPKTKSQPTSIDVDEFDEFTEKLSKKVSDFDSSLREVMTQ